MEQDEHDKHKIQEPRDRVRKKMTEREMKSEVAYKNKSIIKFNKISRCMNKAIKFYSFNITIVIKAIVFVTLRFPN